MKIVIREGEQRMLSIKSRPKEQYSKSSIWPFFFYFLAMFGYILPSMDYFRALPGDLGDSRFNCVLLEHLYQWGSGNVEHLWSPQFFFPFEHVLAFSDNHFGSSPIYILLRFIGLGREAAFSGWIVAGHTCNFIAAYIVIKKSGYSSFASAVGAFIFSFSLPALQKEMHIQLLWRFAIPPAVLGLWRLIKTRQPKYLQMIAFWICVQFYCAIYLGVFLVYLLAAFIAAFFLTNQGTRLFKDIRAAWQMTPSGSKVLLISTVSFFMGAVIWLLAIYHSVSAEYGLVRPVSEISRMLPRLSSYLIADNSGVASWLGHFVTDVPMRHEHNLFFGFSVWLMVLYAAVVVWKSPGQHLLPKTAMIAFFLLAGLTLYLGGVSVYLLVLKLPGVGAIRAVSRIVLVLMFPIAILCSMAVHHLLTEVLPPKHRWRAIAILLLIGFIGSETATYRPYNTSIETWRERVAGLKADLPDTLPPEPILFANHPHKEPFWAISAEIDAMILAQDLGIPTLNGYSGNLTPGFDLGPCISYMTRLRSYREFKNIPEKQLKDLYGRVLLLEPESCKAASGTLSDHALAPD